MGGTYRYDGTAAGLLTLLALLLPHRIVPDGIGAGPPVHEELFPPTTVETDHAAAAELWQDLAKRLPPPSLHLIRRTLLADRPEKEMMICRYLFLALEHGERVAGLLAHPHVAPLWKLAGEVGREAHRYKGFVRFRETTGGFFHAAIAPDHRILPLVAPHFAARFPDQHWVIHDTRHGEGIVHDRERREWLVLPMESPGGPRLTPREETFQGLWRGYFQALAVAERENPRLQQGKVPLKVRPWLVEFS